MKKIIAVLVIVGVIALVALPRILEAVNEDDQVKEEVVITVEGEQARFGNLENKAILTGTSRANKMAPVLASVPADVLDVAVEVGDYVEKDQYLFALDPDSIESQVDQAESAVTNAQLALEQATIGVQSAYDQVDQASLAYDLALANYQVNKDQYDFSKDNLANYESLYNEGIVSKTEYEQMKLQANEETVTLLEKQLEQAAASKEAASAAISNALVAKAQAENGLKQAQDGLERAQEALEDMAFEAPISGYVTSVSVVEDTFFSGQSAAMMVQDLSTIQVSVSVSEKIINKLQPGDGVEVTFKAIGDTVGGTIKTISPSVDAQTLLYPLVIEIDNPEATIKPGMFADVSLVTDRVTEVVYVKANAVFTRQDTSYVYVDNGTEYAELREVELGLDIGDYIEIKSGLSPEDIYITKGIGFITDTTKIALVRGDQ